MYLPSFYKMKFERYSFNARMFLPFLGPVVPWCNHCATQLFGSCTPRSTIWFTLTSFPPREVLSVGSEMMMNDLHNAKYRPNYATHYIPVIYHHHCTLLNSSLDQHNIYSLSTNLLPIWQTR